MYQSLASLFKDIADAIRLKKGTSDTIHTSNFVDEILSIGKPASLEYTNDGTLSNLLSNIANAIRLKRGITGTIKVENFADEILQIIAATPLDTPEIYLHVTPDSDLPDSFDPYVNFIFRLNQVRIVSDLPYAITTGTASVEILFEAGDGGYHLPEIINVTGAKYTWVPQSVTSAKLILEELTTQVEIRIWAERYKLETPYIEIFSSVTFLDEDGTELKTQLVKHGTTPVYSGLLPTKPGDATYKYYVHVGWEPWLEPISDDMVYRAWFVGTNQEYGTITWKNYDGEVLSSVSNIPIRQTPRYSGALPYRPHDVLFTYEFSGWNPRVLPVTGDAIYIAQFDEIRNVQMTPNGAEGLTYTVISYSPQVESNDAGGLTYNIGDVR